jgi:DNA-binding transcriptional ArsR family regulator
MIANIRIIEYARKQVTTPLRAFKAEIFQALAHPTRIAIVEALRDGELGAGALGASLQIEQANLSQHLAVLRSKQVVVSRKAGNQVYYSLRDPVLVQVLDLMKQYFHAHLNDTVALLSEMEPQRRRRT